MNKVLRVSIVAVFAFAGISVLLSCSGQSSAAVSKDLAQKLTDNFVFQGGKQVAGDKPLEHKAEAQYPQVTSLEAPAGLKTGDTFTLVLHTDFATPADVTGAVVAVENNSVYAGNYIDVTAQVAVSGDQRTMTLTGQLSPDFGSGAATFSVKVAMHRTDGQVGNYYVWDLNVNGGASKSVEITNPTSEQKTDAQAMATDILSFGNTIKTLDSGYDQPLSMLYTLYNSTFDLAGTIMADLAGVTTGTAARGLSALADCGSKSGNTITYTCPTGTYTATGTITIAGDQLNIEVQIGQNQGANMVQTVDYNGSLTVTASSVDGTLYMDAKMTANGVNSTFKVQNTYSAITFTASEQCPMGGKESSSISEMTTGSQSAFLFSFDVVFGPSCGDMKMSGTITTK